MKSPNKVINEPNVFPELSSNRLRSVRRLLRRKGRDLAGEFLVEGRQGVREALKHQELISYLIVEDIARNEDLLSSAKIPIFQATITNFNQISDTINSQGIVAVCKKNCVSLTDLADYKLIVVCAQIRDPGNAGNVIRCADAFGADAVVFSKGSVELHNPKTVRSTVGSLFHLPTITDVDLASVLSYFRQRGLKILAADSSGISLQHLQQTTELSAPTAWLFGNEAWGLPESDSKLADQLVAVPMWGEAESLNLSSAAAVCLYASASAQNSKSI